MNISCVNKTHFSSSGYYYTYHTNHQGLKTISYEIPKIKVTLEEKNTSPPEEKKDDSYVSYGLIIGLSIVFGMLIIIGIIFLIMHHRNKKKSKDIDFDIKENIELQTPLASKMKE